MDLAGTKKVENNSLIQLVYEHCKFLPNIIIKLIKKLIINAYTIIIKIIFLSILFFWLKSNPFLLVPLICEPPILGKILLLKRQFNLYADQLTCTRVYTVAICKYTDANRVAGGGRLQP